MNRSHVVFMFGFLVASLLLIPPRVSQLTNRPKPVQVQAPKISPIDVRNLLIDPFTYYGGMKTTRHKTGLIKNLHDKGGVVFWYSVTVTRVPGLPVPIEDVTLERAIIYNKRGQKIKVVDPNGDPDEANRWYWVLVRYLNSVDHDKMTHTAKAYPGFGSFFC